MSDPPYLDTVGMWEAAAALPEQLTETLEAAGRAFPADALPASASIRAVALFGLGTSATATRAAAALVAPHLPVPLWAGSGPAVPAFVGPGTLVGAVSTSGGTPETLDALREALAHGARAVAIGGDDSSALARLAADAGVPWCPVVPSGPARAPRSARPPSPCWSCWRSAAWPPSAPGRSRPPRPRWPVVATRPPRRGAAG